MRCAKEEIIRDGPGLPALTTRASGSAIEGDGKPGRKRRDTEESPVVCVKFAVTVGTQAEVSRRLIPGSGA